MKLLYFMNFVLNFFRIWKLQIQHWNTFDRMRVDRTMKAYCLKIRLSSIVDSQRLVDTVTIFIAEEARNFKKQHRMDGNVQKRWNALRKKIKGNRKKKKSEEEKASSNKSLLMIYHQNPFYHFTGDLFVRVSRTCVTESALKIGDVLVHTHTQPYTTECVCT